MKKVVVGYPFRAVDRWATQHDEPHGHCYFCRPELYEPLWEGCDLCVRCGVLMWTGRTSRVTSNPRMIICEDCEEEMTA